MSSGNFEYTLEERACLLDQFASAMKITQERQRPAKKVSLALQAIIGEDDIIVAPKIIQTPTGKIFHVIGNFASAAEAITAGNYPVKRGFAERPEDIPLIIQPVDSLVRAVPLGRYTKAGDMFGLYPRTVDPMTALTFGARFPEEQRVAPHIALWKDAKGELWYVLLEVLDGQRYVLVDPVHPGLEFRVYCRVLVREFSLSA